MEDSKLAAVEDAYGGVIVKQEALVSDPIEFRDQLSQSIEVGSNSRYLWHRLGTGVLIMPCAQLLFGMFLCMRLSAVLVYCLTRIPRITPADLHVA